MLLMILNFKNSNLFGVTEFVSFLYTITYNFTFTVKQQDYTNLVRTLIIST